MLHVYGIKSCDTCRKAKKFLQDNKLEFDFHDLRDDGLDIQTLEVWADRVGWEKLLNKKSLTWRKVPETDRKVINRSKAISLMLDQPTLIKRPILEGEGYIAVGFSEQRFAEFLSKMA